MKVGITGHRGFIGGHIYNRLRIEQHEVIPYEQNIQSWGKFEDKYPFDEFRHCDLIINLAGKNKGTDKEIISTNVFGTANLLQWCYSHNKKIILAGTDYKNPGVYKHGRDTIKALAKCYEYSNNAFGSCILNMPKIIGPGCKPRYNSFVTTLVYLAAEGVLPQYLFEIKNRDEEVELLHVDDVCDTVVDLINHPFFGYTEYEFNKLDGKFTITLGDIADILLDKNTTHPKAEMFLELREWYKKDKENAKNK